MLLAYVNQLSSALHRGQSAAVLGDVLSGLGPYTRLHFRNEERLFALHGWSEGLEHAGAHRAFEAQIQGFQARMAAGDASLAEDVLRFLVSWLAEHILVDDIAFGPFFKALGVR